jgi:anti-sigma factor ChrR (cupin superfamily)
MRTVGMSDHWTDRLSEYIDGDMAAPEARELEQHLKACDACRVTLHELRTVIAAAAALEDAEPRRDLWAGIASGIGAAAEAHTGTDRATIDLREYAARRAAPRRFTFSMPQLAAAAVVLVSLSAGAMWWLGGGAVQPETAAGVIVQTAAGPSNDVRLVSTTPVASPHDADIARLERTLDEARGQLDPATVEVLERSLESIDQAIGDARAALEADPGNEQIARQLDNTMQKKLDVLRRAQRVQRAGT